MSQIKQGTVQTTNNSNVVKGLDVEWELVVPGCLFIVDGESVSYEIVGRNLGLTPPEIYLSANYIGPTITSDPGVAHTIVRDFTSAANLPLMSPGDVETATIFSRAMRIIDTVLAGGSIGGGGGGGGGDSSLTFSKTAHGYVVGTILRIDNSGNFEVASSDTAANFQYVGMVSEVVDVDTFKLKCEGYVDSVAQTLSPGSVYYLKGSPSVSNGLTTNSNEAGIKSPIFVARSASAGFFLGAGGGGGSNVMLGATDTLPGASGLVPQPQAGDDSKVLRGDGTWGNSAVSDNSLTFKTLKDGPFTDGDWADIDPEDSILGALNNLNGRLSSQRFALPTVLKKEGKPGDNTLLVNLYPAISRLRFRAWGSGQIPSGSNSTFFFDNSRAPYNSYGAGGAYVEGFLDLTGPIWVYVGYVQPNGNSYIDTVIRQSGPTGTILLHIRGHQILTPTLCPSDWIYMPGSLGALTQIVSTYYGKGSTTATGGYPAGDGSQGYGVGGAVELAKGGAVIFEY